MLSGPWTRRGLAPVLGGFVLADSLTGTTLGKPEVKIEGDNKRKKRKKRQRKSCGDCVCPPDRRLAEIEACRAQHGVAVSGECDCAWFNGDESPGDFPCNGDCLCWLTAEGTGFCGEFNPPLPEQGNGDCVRNADCPPVPAGPGLVFDRACVFWPHSGGRYCWPACQPRPVT
jgi:hypothetical protein